MESECVITGACEREGFSPLVARKQRETNIPIEFLKISIKGRKDMTGSRFWHQMNETKKKKRKHMTAPRYGWRRKLIVEKRESIVRGRDIWESPD